MEVAAEYSVCPASISTNPTLPALTSSSPNCATPIKLCNSICATSIAGGTFTPGANSELTALGLELLTKKWYSESISYKSISSNPPTNPSRRPIGNCFIT